MGRVRSKAEGQALDLSFRHCFLFCILSLFLLSMIPHLCLYTLSDEDMYFCYSTATVLLRHRWDGVLDRVRLPATMLLRYRVARLVGFAFF